MKLKLLLLLRAWAVHGVSFPRSSTTAALDWCISGVWWDSDKPRQERTLRRGVWFGGSGCWSGRKLLRCSEENSLYDVDIPSQLVRFHECCFLFVSSGLFLHQRVSRKSPVINTIFYKWIFFTANCWINISSSYSLLSMSFSVFLLYTTTASMNSSMLKHAEE